MRQNDIGNQINTAEMCTLCQYSSQNVVHKDDIKTSYIMDPTQRVKSGIK